MSDPHDATEPALERFVFFSDAVFAIAITLLAIEIKVPTLPPEADETAWVAALVDLIPSFATFGLSFFAIGSIWTAHHGLFRLVARFDQRLMTPNLLLLLAVVMLPFSSALLGRTIHAPAPYAFYSATLLVAGASKAWLTGLALRPNLIRRGIPPDVVKITRRGSLVMPIAAALALGLAFVIPAWNNLAMLLLLTLRFPALRVRA